MPETEIFLVFEKTTERCAPCDFSPGMMLRQSAAACAFSRCRGLLHFEHCSCRLAFVLVDQRLKLRRKFRVGGADRQALEEKCSIVQLLAPVLLERLVVRLVHRLPPWKLHASFVQSPS
ncbi:hypothetical protein [Bradyrhizobium lablabi]|uniref:hypothetical protein n=1 Tax=Bradyrhizobium lablabi TaxID=722472 RepID=UPI0012E32EFA|nr:hypothetical protein [Bradyrhizobium lablabi]